MNLRLTLALALTIGLHFLSGCRLLKADPHIAFFGDSLIEAWWYPTANLGHHGDTTTRLLARFPAAIPGHGYTTVVILGGSNDIQLDLDPTITIHNLELLGVFTTQQHAEPILCKIPPIFHSWVPGNTTNYQPQVLELNRRIAQLAAEHHWRLVDFYTPLVGHPNYSTDGTHLNRSGYLVMTMAVRRTLSHR
ncbi:MAG: GDSL-type esterase/lipase family protein [Edaphobacter sp.]